MSNVSPSAYGENDPVLKERLAKCQSLPEITETMRQRALELGAERDSINPEILHFEGMQTPADDSAAGTVSRTVKIAGVDVTFSDSSVPALENQISAALETAAANGGGGTQPRGADGKFTSRRELSVAEKTELDLRFRRNEISAPEYLKQSGALEDAFATFAKEKLGVDPDALRTNQQTQDAWAEVTQKWLNSPEGATWEGGGDENENLRRVTEIIIANGLENSPSVQTLNQVVTFMRQNHLLVPRAGTTQNAIEQANSVEEISAASRASLGMPPRNSNLWGR
jgi:hypothetical protein